jgi:signal transduction histidine kinase
MIYGDPHRYQQILLNFISNSLKFCNPGGYVRIKVGVIKISKAIREDFDVIRRSST